MAPGPRKRPFVPKLCEWSRRSRGDWAHSSDVTTTLSENTPDLAMNGTLLLIELAGHVGLLLWGTHMVGTGVQRGFGPVLRRALGRNLDSPLHAFLTGLGVTTLLQSSTATGLLASSFAATGVISLAPALAVMLGANVGTALLTQLLSVNMALVGPPLVLAGVLAFRWSTIGRLKNVGRIGIGLGLMLMALAGLVHTLGPLESAPLLRPVLSSLSGDPVLTGPRYACGANGACGTRAPRPAGRRWHPGYSRDHDRVL